MKVILVLSDGLRYDTAVESMGYLGHLVEVRRATRYKMTGELPSLSRPMYETIHTGLPVSRHGITTNAVVRPSSQPNLFQLAAQAGKVTAAAAYSWFSELYNGVPYDRIDDREVDDASRNIQHGRFYTEDDIPDLEVFAAAAMLVRKYAPDYLLVHPMGMDYVGETYGADTAQYRKQAIRQDSILAVLLPEWTARGYSVLVSADHGINRDGAHGGTTPDVRAVPLFIVPADGSGRGAVDETCSHLQIAPTILHLLGLPIPASMEHPPLEGNLVNCR